MVELYQDTLVDLLLPKNAKRMKLEVKKDSKVSPLYQDQMELIFLFERLYESILVTSIMFIVSNYVGHWYSSVCSIFVFVVLFLVNK